MSRKRRQQSLKAVPDRQVERRAEREEKKTVTHGWLGEHSQLIPIVGVLLIALCTVIIYGQTLRVAPLDYEDPYYLLHNPYLQGKTIFSGLSAIWDEPYFANFHPVTTTTWRIDRAVADKTVPFDSLPFRIAHLAYAVIGAALSIFLLRRLGIPAMLAALGGLIFAVHPIHTEVVAWLSARKDLVSFIFIVLSFLSWLWARIASNAAQWRSRHALTVLLVLLAILSKPISVILPALFVAYEFCSGTHLPVTSWRWAHRGRQPLLTRTLALTAIFVLVGGTSTAIFRSILQRDPRHGGWLILVALGFVLLLTFAPSQKELAASRDGKIAGMRVLGPPFLILSVVFGAGCAWTFWAQQQVGAIKGGLPLLPTLNLTFDAMLAYAGKAFIPAWMSASYSWNEYPYISLRGLLGAALVCSAVWLGARLSGSEDRNRRLIAFGIFWYLIALIPVLNLVPTSTKMADRYLFVPTVGIILALLALAASLHLDTRRHQFALCGALILVIALYAGWAYKRTEVWCGKTTDWNGHPQPDLSLWTAVVEVNPEDTHALTSLGLTYLRLTPPQAEQALVYLNRALRSGEHTQSKIAGNTQLILSPVYEGLGDGYLTWATQLNPDTIGSDVWKQRKEAFASALKYFSLASNSPSGFASSDARVLSRLAEACEGVAQMDAQLATAAPEHRQSAIAERDKLRGESEESMRKAREILASGNVPSIDPNYRTVLIGEGNIIFGREVGAPNEEKVHYYQQALIRYQEAAALLPDDPRPWLYEGLCYERLAGITQSPEDKHQQFILGEQALRKALTLNPDAPDYSVALPYRALASLYVHVNNFESALDALKKAREADPTTADSTQLDRDIQSVEQFLAQRGRAR
jgi:tetratricopeptide (TPR) repeat protein